MITLICQVAGLWNSLCRSPEGEKVLSAVSTLPLVSRVSSTIFRRDSLEAKRTSCFGVKITGKRQIKARRVCHSAEIGEREVLRASSSGPFLLICCPDKYHFSLLVDSSVFALCTARKPCPEDVLSVFTDASVSSRKAGFGIFAGPCSPLNRSVRVDDENSVENVEKLAAIVALKQIKQLGMDKKHVIVYTDCRNILQELVKLKRRLAHEEHNSRNREYQSLSQIVSWKTEQLAQQTAEAKKLLDSKQTIAACVTETIAKIGAKFKKLELIEQRLRNLKLSWKALSSGDWKSQIEAVKELLQECSTPVPKNCRTTMRKFYTQAILDHASACGRGVTFVYVPAHTGVAQNEIADVLARLAVKSKKSGGVSKYLEQSCESNRRDELFGLFKRWKLRAHSLEAVYLPHDPTNFDSQGLVQEPQMSVVWEQMGEHCRLEEKLQDFASHLKAIDVRRLAHYLQKKEKFKWSDYPALS